jgi:hypothetical protein
MLGAPARARTGQVFADGELGVVLAKPAMTKHQLDGVTALPVTPNQTLHYNTHWL